MGGHSSSFGPEPLQRALDELTRSMSRGVSQSTVTSSWKLDDSLVSRPRSEEKKTRPKIRKPKVLLATQQVPTQVVKQAQGCFSMAGADDEELLNDDALEELLARKRRFKSVYAMEAS